MKWRVYYTGGATFSDKDGSPFEAPALGVQTIVQADPEVGRYIVARRDYYWWDVERDRWFGGDYAGFFQYMVTPGPRRALFGHYVTNAEYEACAKAAHLDPDFPPKSARHPDEVL